MIILCIIQVCLRIISKAIATGDGSLIIQSEQTFYCGLDNQNIVAFHILYGTFMLR